MTERISILDALATQFHEKSGLKIEYQRAKIKSEVVQKYSCACILASLESTAYETQQEPAENHRISIVAQLKLI